MTTASLEAKEKDERKLEFVEPDETVTVKESMESDV